ncbi:NAD+ synthase [Ancylobacter dichloromethanicus]|uniref:Glutamine-dependent NAD(+) synthetase n=1 Tax=Ancylobacter dichloromethanicus TaxID=518825 RepID=A0A9W6J5Z2_9HYPH|nr:NAD+ synthase [Ancylobacter dichloromethanicus]MBS7553032.1 NAD+ synthase [Ancylobacter dichloromethanicus]GLK70353.1 NAD+ synthase [Ancylobacter dichloromethanicus]
MSIASSPTAPADQLLIAFAQLDPVVGDIAGNTLKVREARALAAGQGAELVVFTELFLSGYPPEDLVLKPSFQAACRRAVEQLAAETADGGPALLLGAPWLAGGKLHNAVLLLDAGRVAGARYKVDLPNYGVFDEKRVFAPGPMPGPIAFRGVRLGVPVCEDVWSQDVIECLAETGAEILLIPNGSPYRRGVQDERLNVAVARVVESGLPLAYVNQVGGQDELVFDGGSFVLNADRSLAVQLPNFQQRTRLTRWERWADGWRCEEGARAPLLQGDEADYAACVLGLRDYVENNGFPGVVLGLSGGIDSALAAAMAVDALGPERVHCVMLPYRFTSEESLADAAGVAQALGVRYDILPIAEGVEALETVLAPLFEGTARDVTEENLQSRVRGTLLMSLSNKFGAMVVTTGNKSEMSTGYATLYGDMNGGYNPLKDLYKTQVFRLCELRNRWKPAEALGPSGTVIPANIIAKPPTAELRDNQTDQDSLPPYEVLDAVLERLVERDMPLADIVAEGFEPALVARVERLLALAEYKRRQAAPGVKVTARHFGRDRRYPITNRFRETV